jgi:hypothetical protein
MSVPKLVDTLYSRITDALEVAVKYGQIDGTHHKQWVINEMMRQLVGNYAPAYEKLVAVAKAGEDGPDTYDWDEGCPP